MRDDDDLILWTGDLPARIAPGQYDGIVTSLKKVDRFGLRTLEMWWEIITEGAAYQARIISYCNLGPTKQARIRPRSKLAGWLRRIGDFTGLDPQHVRLGTFRQFQFRIEVETVTHDVKQRPLPELDQYSVVREIIAVVGKLAEGPPYQ